VIGAAPGRVAAVVSGDDKQIVLLQSRQEFAQSVIECFQRSGIAPDIATVAVDGIKIDEVGKQEAALLQRIKAFQGAIEQAFIAVALQDSTRSAMRENIPDLADGDDVAAGLGCKIKDGPTRRRNGIVAAVVGPGIASVRR
jgi:hypothetical protein